MPNVQGGRIDDPQMFIEMDDLELCAQGIVEGAMHGVHRSPYTGFSVEFDSHRNYQIGDDLRHVNWKIWARTNQLHIKQFKADTNMNLYLIMDITGSMSSSNGLSHKWHYSARAAASLAFVAQAKRDAVGLTLINGQVSDHITPRLRPGHFQELVAVLERVKPKGRADVSLAMNEVLNLCRRRGVVVLFSDLFDDEKQILNACSNLRSMGHEVIVFHMLDPWEVEMPEKGMYEFRDLETGKKLKVNTAEVRDSYNDVVSKWLVGLKKECENIGVEYVQCLTSDSLSDLVVNFLHDRQQVV